MKIWPIAIVAVSAALAGSAVGAESARIHQGGPLRTGAAPVREAAVAGKPAPIRIGVVLNPLDNPYWLTIYQGASVEAARLGVRATFRAVTSSSDLAGQAAQLRALVAAREDCYAVAPIAATNLVSALRGVSRPVVVINSPIDPAAARRAHVRLVTYIGTDDFAAGMLAGTRMASLLRRGQVALLGGWAGNINSVLRLGGFERGIRGTRLRVVGRVAANYDRTTAEIASERILRAHPHIAGFFAADDLMALGIADSVDAAGMAGKVKIIGMDGIPDALNAIRAGSLSATSSQYPYAMGKMAIEACTAAARGAKLPDRVNAPIALLTKGDVASAMAGYPMPLQRYSDPFSRLLRGGG